jgi:hypothetical protein
MEKSSTLHWGFDVPKDRFDIATAEACRDGPVHHVGTIGGTWQHWTSHRANWSAGAAGCTSSTRPYRAGS